MDTNQVGSINFDANNLYLEEESEHEDEKQQDNEIKELISQGGLDDLLDDESFGSDDDDDDEDSSSANENDNHPKHIINQVNSDDDNLVPGNDEKMFSPKMNPPNSTALPVATPLVIANNNYQLNDYRNQFSTPSTNQMPPLPSAQMLQATVIPNICEEKLFFQRQRQAALVETTTPTQVVTNTNNNNNTSNTNTNTNSTATTNSNTDVAMSKFNPQPTQTPYPVNNETITYTAQFEALNAANYMQLQQQHFVSHSKMHSLDRFAVSSVNDNLMPKPAPQRLITDLNREHPHEHLTNDPELSLNVSDNDDDDFNHKPQIDTVTPTTASKYPIASFGNGIQLEFSATNTTENLDAPQRRTEEVSAIDLNELDENQLNQLKIEQEQKNNEIFNLDNLNKNYVQLQFLHKVRGKKLEEVETRFAAYQEDTSREIRAMKHRLTLGENERATLQSKLEQAHEMCQQYLADLEQNKKSLCDMQDKNDKLKQSNRLLEQKLNENEEIIDNLQMQLSEQQKLDAMERIQEQHEHYVQQLREQYDKDVFQMKEKINELQTDLNEKHNRMHVLSVQLETANKNSEQAALERNETINRLTKNLNDLQVKYDQDVILTNLSAGKKINLQTNDSNQFEVMKIEIDKLNKLVEELQRELDDKNAKIDEMMAHGEQFEHMKASLELELYNKQQQINECEKLIEQLHQTSQHEVSQRMIGSYEAQIGELQLKVTNRENELAKMREHYMEVCNEKNNLHDSLKQQYDQEYEVKLKQRIDLVVSSKLEEQNTQLREKWQQERAGMQDEFRRQCDTYLNELKQCREQLFASEKQYDQMRVDKSNLEIKANRVECELKEKVFQLQKQVDELASSRDKKEFELNNEISTLRLDLAQASEAKTKLNDKLANLEIDCSNLLNEKSNLVAKLDAILSERDSFKVELNRLNEAKSGELARADLEINELKSKLELNKQEVLKLKSDAAKQNELSMRELEKTLSEKYEQVLEEAHKEFNIKLTELNQSKLKSDNEKKLEIESLKLKFEEKKKEWEEERQEALKKRDEESQKEMDKLRERFEEDYARFVQAHKETFQRTMSEKTQEFASEKEALIRMHEKKVADWEVNEKQLMQKIRELKSVNSPVISFNKPKQIDAKCQTEEEEDQSSEIDHFVEKIKDLEQIIANTDLHFEQELEKMRQDIESDYQIKLERSELNQRQLEHELEMLRSKSTSKSSSDTSSLDNNETAADFDLIYSSKSKYSKLKQELHLKEKEVESIEQAYRHKLEQLQEKYDANLKHIQSKQDTEVNRVRLELNENYKKELAKSRNQIDQMQLFVEKLKKTNSDSDRVIESLKQEMAKSKEAHLDELASMKLSLEREKENLKEKLEQAQQRVLMVEQRLAESDEHLKKQCDVLRTELKQEYGAELSRMNAKMKDMMKSHASSVELLKKQHKNLSKINSSVYQNNKTCQTETSLKDIEMLETFRQRYLDTVARMKSDMLKHFDAQTQRNNERLERQLNEERTLVYERLHQIFLPKIIDLLREYRVSEALIDIKMSELEHDLKQITTFTSARAKSDDGVRLKSRTNSPVSSLANNYISNIVVASPRSSHSSELYSKSACSIRDVQAAPPPSVTSNAKTDSVDNICDSTKKTYKYTPLRQSCSNLNQINQLTQLSPSYSITSNSSDKFKSPRMQTASLNKQSKLDSELIYKSQENLNQLNEDDKSSNDYVFYNDDSDNETHTEPVSNTNFYKKYRTQNIRQKKIKQQQTSVETERPQSASSLLAIKSKSSLYSSSASELNPIGTLYERSKNYKSLKQLEDDNQKKSTLVSRSSTQLSNLIDETPTKLDAEIVISTTTTTNNSKPTLRSAQSVINGSTSLTRPSSLLSSKSVSTKSSSISSSNSSTSSSRGRNRSRTPTSTSSSLNNNINLNDQPYMQATVASSSKIIDSNVTSHSSSSTKSNLSTTSSTQYLPISIQKKRTIF